MSGLTLFSPLAVCAALLVSLAVPAPAAAQQALTLNCPFDDNVAPSPVWTFSGAFANYWAVDDTPAVANTPSATASGGNSLNYNNGSNFNSGGTNSGSARSPSIDLVAATGATLTFWCRYQTETTATAYDQRWFRVLNASGTVLNSAPNGQQLAQTGGAITCSAGYQTWHTHSINLTPYVGNVIQLEFFFNSVDSVANDGQGWAIDDVVILSDDVTPPDDITDLDAKNPTDTSIQLSWSAPADDDISGLADTYDLRRSTTPITDANFDTATQVTGEPAPGVPGNVHTLTVGQLTAGTTYYFAIKTTDFADNTSGISNVPSETTTGGAAAGGGGGLGLSGPGFEEEDEDILPCSAGTTAAPAGLMALAGLLALAFGLRKKA